MYAPTVQASVAESALTPTSTLRSLALVVPPGFGLDALLQLAPFQCNARVSVALVVGLV
jgi:hypothetical protein